jgi:PKD repeat protein
VDNVFRIELLSAMLPDFCKSGGYWQFLFLFWQYDGDVILLSHPFFFIATQKENKMSHKFFRLITSLFLALSLIAIASGAQRVHAAGPWYVATTGDDNNDCLSPATACATINGALAKPGFVSGDTVRVAIGIYTDTGNEVVLIDKGVTLSGGWNASFTTQNDTSTIDGEGTRRGITIIGTLAVLIERFVVQNGFADYGGGIASNFGPLTLNNSLIRNNTASSSGGGIYHYWNGILNLNQTTVSNNTGGGILIDGDSGSGSTATLNNSMVVTNTGYGISNFGSLIIENSTIDRNSGIGVFNYWHDLTINNSTISNNVGTDDGGGLHNHIGNVVLNNTTISGNSAIYRGGGISVYSGTVSLNNSTLSSNITTSGIYGGGGIYNSGATVVFNASTINGNVSGSDGGGINNDSGTLTIINSTISGNSAIYRGGGILNYSGIVSLYNSTLSENTTSIYEGGGIYNYGAYSAAVTFRNTLLAGNTASGSGSDCSGTISSSGYNVIGDVSNCVFAAVTGDLINTDPLLGSLQNNGGPTFTHALLALSLAIDAGDPAGCTDQDGNLITTDQRGFNRTEGTRCDIGAYEYSDITTGPAISLAILSGNGQQTLQNTAFFEPLRVVALDSQGNRVSGVNVIFTAPSSGPSGTFADTGTNTTSVDTDAGGAATTSVFTANDQLGAYTVSASAAGLGSVNFSLEQIIPSPDNFVDAQAITSLPFSATADITDATNEPGEPLFCNISERTVWYSFTPTENMTVRADTLGSAVAGVVNVYSSGSGISDLNFLGCWITHGSVNFNAEAGKTYYLQVGSAYFGEVGSVQINLEQIFPPANDNFANTEAITALPYTATVDITDATYEPSEPQACYSMERTVWYSFTPTEDLAIRATTEGSAVSGNINIYHATGPGISDLQFLNCSGGSNNSQPFIAEAGQTYYLQVGFASWEVGSVQINLEQVLPPANDDFASAISIDAFPSTTDFTNSGAMMESGEPGLSCDYGSPSAQSTVWFSFTATQDETISANIFNSTFPPIWAVYTGTSLSELTELGCRYYDNLSWRAIAGQTYYIQISGLYGSSGTGTLSLEPASPPQAYFYFDPFDPSISETIQFYDYSYDPAGIGIEIWEWDFGDGTPQSTDQYPTHMYAADGDYSVTLTVTTFDGRSASVTQTVQVRTQFTYTIDIKPGSQTNPINPRSSGKIPVVILSTPDFNAPLDVDRTSLTFGRTGNELSLVSCNRRGEDVNGDGLKDLVCHFKTKLTGFKFGDTEGILRGLTLGGVSIEARDVVRVLHASYP